EARERSASGGHRTASAAGAARNDATVAEAAVPAGRVGRPGAVRVGSAHVRRAGVAVVALSVRRAGAARVRVVDVAVAVVVDAVVADLGGARVHSRIQIVAVHAETILALVVAIAVAGVVDAHPAEAVT